MIIDKFYALTSLRPNSKWTMTDDVIDWQDTETTMPTEDEINNEIARLQISHNRKVSYPDIGDQLDDLFKAGAFSEEMTATLQAVKDKYPKE